MPRDTRSKHEHWVIGSSTDVLKNTFVESYCRADQIDMSTARPFSGPLMLPTKGECLKLWWFFKDSDGRKNVQSLFNGTITGMVVKVISQYWIMAGYENEAEEMKLNDGTKYKVVSDIVKSYNGLLKSRSKNSDKAKSDRDAFLDDMATCLNFGVKNLRDRLLSDRVRSNLGVQMEDLDFLDDQFGPTKRWSMSNTEDKEFAARKAANLKRRLPPRRRSLLLSLLKPQPHMMMVMVMKIPLMRRKTRKMKTLTLRLLQSRERRLQTGSPLVFQEISSVQLWPVL